MQRRHGNLAAKQRGVEIGQPQLNSINIESRFWFNPAAISRDFLVPGSIALIMTVIGALLTSLVSQENGSVGLWRHYYQHRLLAWSFYALN